MLTQPNSRCQTTLFTLNPPGSSLAMKVQTTSKLLWTPKSNACGQSTLTHMSSKNPRNKARWSLSFRRLKAHSQGKIALLQAHSRPGSTLRDCTSVSFSRCKATILRQLAQIFPMWTRSCGLSHPPRQIVSLLSAAQVMSSASQATASWTSIAVTRARGHRSGSTTCICPTIPAAQRTGSAFRTSATWAPVLLSAITKKTTWMIAIFKLAVTMELNARRAFAKPVCALGYMFTNW
jgi:hypothetical protein